MLSWSGMLSKRSHNLPTTATADCSCPAGATFSGRSPRKSVETLVPASVHRGNGQRTKGNLHTVSTTGGLLQLARALGRGDFVEIAFQTQAGVVQGLAEMLDPRKQPADGVLQAFRFVALADDDHRMLRMTVDSATDRKSLKFDSLPRA